MRKIKILFFHPNEFFGPEMNVMAQVIRHLDQTRFSSYLVVNSDATGTLKLSEADGVTLYRLKFGRGLRGSGGAGLASVRHLPSSVLRMARYARKEGIEIVHCSGTPRAAIMGFIAARLAGARLLLHYHVLPGRYAGPRRLLENVVSKRADRAVAVSEFLASQIPSTGIPRDKIDVVVNGVDVSRFNPGVDGTVMRQEYGIAPDEILVLQLARIIQQKRQEDVVRAVAIARRREKRLRCLIVGWEDPRYTGPFPSYRAELEHIAAQENLGESLMIMPARREAAELIAASDIVAMPSIGDAWNLVVTEAMAVGRPVIGANSGGIPEQIVDGETGFLVPERSPEVLADRMMRLAQDSELRHRMGTAAWQRAEACFDEKFVGTGFARIYEALARR